MRKAPVAHRRRRLDVRADVAGRRRRGARGRRPPSGSPPAPSSRPTRGVTDRPGPEPCSVEEHLARVLRRSRAAGAGRPSRCWRRSGWPAPRTSSRPMSLPSFDNSAMDGYAVRRADVPGPPPSSRWCCRSSARSAPARPGCARWRRGRRQDHDRRPDPGGRRRGRPLRVDRPRRREGADRPGARARPARPPRRRGRRGRRPAGRGGTVLTPRHIGLLASVGRATVLARPRPRVVVLSTGSELREPGERARLRLDLRRQLLHARRGGTSGRRDRLPGRHRARRARRVPRVAARPAGPRRPRRHLRRGLAGRLRRREGRAAPRGRLVRPGRDAAGQAAGLRPRRRGAGSRSSRCPATRCRPTSPSRCSCCPRSAR